MSARAAFRLTEIELELPQWDKVQKLKRLTGCSLTGYMDCYSAMMHDAEANREVIVTALNKHPKLAERIEKFLLEKYNITNFIETLSLEELFLVGLHIQAHIAVEEYCKELGIENPHEENPLITTIKPEGTLTLLSKSSSQGIHCSFAEYYIRRVRIGVNSPLVKIYTDKGYPCLDENISTDPNKTTKVFEFPIKAVKGIFKKDITAIEQLERYKTFMKFYVDHNASNTIEVRRNEWEGVENWIYDNWDDIVAISLFSADENNYYLPPYEEITKEEYDRRMSQIKIKTNVGMIISASEDEDLSIDSSMECKSGHCPIR